MASTQQPTSIMQPDGAALNTDSQEDDEDSNEATSAAAPQPTGHSPTTLDAMSTSLMALANTMKSTHAGIANTIDRLVHEGSTDVTALMNNCIAALKLASQDPNETELAQGAARNFSVALQGFLLIVEGAGIVGTEPIDSGVRNRHTRTSEPIVRTHDRERSRSPRRREGASAAASTRRRSRSPQAPRAVVEVFEAELPTSPPPPYTELASDSENDTPSPRGMVPSVNDPVENLLAQQGQPQVQRMQNVREIHRQALGFQNRLPQAYQPLQQTQCRLHPTPQQLLQPAGALPRPPNAQNVPMDQQAVQANRTMSQQVVPSQQSPTAQAVNQQEWAAQHYHLRTIVQQQQQQLQQQRQQLQQQQQQLQQQQQQEALRQQRQNHMQSMNDTRMSAGPVPPQQMQQTPSLCFFGQPNNYQGSPQMPIQPQTSTYNPFYGFSPQVSGQIHGHLSVLDQRLASASAVQYQNAAGQNTGMQVQQNSVHMQQIAQRQSQSSVQSLGQQQSRPTQQTPQPRAASQQYNGQQQQAFARQLPDQQQRRLEAQQYQAQMAIMARQATGQHQLPSTGVQQQQQQHQQSMTFLRQSTVVNAQSGFQQGNSNVQIQAGQGPSVPTMPATGNAQLQQEPGAMNGNQSGSVQANGVGTGSGRVTGNVVGIGQTDGAQQGLEDPAHQVLALELRNRVAQRLSMQGPDPQGASVRVSSVVHNYVQTYFSLPEEVRPSVDVLVDRILVKLQGPGVQQQS